MEEINKDTIIGGESNSHYTPPKAVDLSGLSLHDQIIEAIKTVYDPEIPVNIFELGLIYEVAIGEDNKVDVLMTLTSPGCPAAGMLPGDVEEKVRSVSGTGDVKVEVTFEPPWDQSMMTDEAKLELGFM